MIANEEVPDGLIMTDLSSEGFSVGGVVPDFHVI